MLPFRRYRRFAFSLLEILVVLAILSIMVLGTQIVMRGPMSMARIRNTLETIRTQETLARSQARKTRESTEITIDLNSQEMSWKLTTTPTKRTVSVPYLLNVKFREGNPISTTISIDQNGRSQSYAYQVGNRHDPRWLFVAGGSGQFIELRSEEEVDEALRLVATSDDSD